MAYQNLPSPSLVNGKISFVVPGTAGGVLSVRRRAVGTGVPGEAAVVAVAAAAPQLLIDPTFQQPFTGNETTGWVADAEVQRLGAGQVRFQGPETRFLFQRISMLAGRRYYVRVDISSYTSGGLDVGIVGFNNDMDGLNPVRQMQSTGTFTSIITTSINRENRFYLVTNANTNLVVSRFSLQLLDD